MRRTSRNPRRKTELPPPTVGFFNVLSSGPLIIVRAPMVGKRGKRKLVPKWSHFTRALTPMMQSHGMLKKDVVAIESFVQPDEWDGDPNDFWYARELQTHRYGSTKTIVEEARDTMLKAERAFAGDRSIFSKFWLYDWSDADGGSFVLVREPSVRET